MVLSTIGLSLTAADFSTSMPAPFSSTTTARRCSLVGTDETGPGSGITTWDIYYVQDIDTGAGSQSWAVDMVATVEGLTRSASDDR